MGKQTALAALGGGSLFLAAFAPPPYLETALPAEEGAAVLTLDGQEVRAAVVPVEPGQQYPSPRLERPAEPVAAPPPTETPKPTSRRADWRLSVDLSAIADSNRTNGTDLETVPIDYGEGPLPVPLDPRLRERAGLGAGASVSAGGRIPLAGEAALALDAEGYVVEYGGGANDDASLLLAAGIALGSGAVPDASVQLIAFDRWYGGVEAMEGIGLRGNYRHAFDPRQTLRLSVDARIFESGYGEAFGGTQASVYLAYDRVLDPGLSASIGVWGHREWLHDKAFSYGEIGAYGGLSRYFGQALTGGATAGLSRTSFDRPFLMLGPEARRDWRVHGSLWLMARRPVAWGLTPSLTYTYNRTASSIGYYSNSRHRLRVGLSRRF